MIHSRLVAQATMILALLGGIGPMRAQLVSPGPARATENAAKRWTDLEIAAADAIVGRGVRGSEVWLLTQSRLLIRFDHQSARVRRARLSGLRSDDEPWGLALLADGTAWTLLNRMTLGRLSPEGAIDRRMALAQPHVGLYGFGDHLVYQVIDPTIQGALLSHGVAWRRERLPFGSLIQRPFQLIRAEMWGRNLVLCGVGQGSELPCWFPDETIIDLVSPGGRGRQVRLTGVVGSRQSRKPPDTSSRPVRDVVARSSGDLYVLEANEPGDPADPGPHVARELCRYSPRGDRLEHRRLETPARMILGVNGAQSVLLSSSGRIDRVTF